MEKIGLELEPQCACGYLELQTENWPVIFPYKACHLNTYLLFPVLNKLLPFFFACFPSLGPGMYFMENVPSHVYIRPLGEPHWGSLIPTVLFQSEYSRSNDSFPVLYFTRHLVTQYLDFEPQNDQRDSLDRYYYLHFTERTGPKRKLAQGGRANVWENQG